MSFIADLANMGKAPTPASPDPITVPFIPTHKDMKDKIKALDLVKTQLNKQFECTQSLVRLGDKIGKDMPSQSTGLPTLDWSVFGCGGVPNGRIIEIYGPESAGKTTLTLAIIAAYQKAGKLAAFVDAEHALDPNYAKTLGVDVDNLYVSQPDSGEQALETVIALVDSGALSIIVVDSVAALVPKAELDGEMGDSHMGLQARLMSQACRKLTGRLAKSGCSVIFINQIREKIGVMFGNPETTTGGRALKFYSSVRIDVRRKFVADTNLAAKQVGHTLVVKNKKNKVATPFHETEIYLDYENGLDRFGDFITYCKDMGVISGTTWLKFDGENIGQGLDKTIENLRGNDALVTKIEAALAKARAVTQEVK